MTRLRWAVAIAVSVIVIVLVRRRTGIVDPLGVSDPSGTQIRTLASDRGPAADLDAAANEPSLASNRERTAVVGSPRGIKIGGRVLDFTQPGGGGVLAPGVEVRLAEGFWGEKEDSPVRTGDDGRFAFEVADSAERPLHFTVAAEGAHGIRRATAEATLVKGQTENLDLVLRRYPMGDLVGTTVDTKDRPLSGVHLSIRFNEVAHEADSDSQGEFRIPDADWIEGLEARREGYTLLLAAKPMRIEEGGWEPMRVVLAPATRLVVHVIDGHGEGITAASVAASVSKWELRGSRIPVLNGLAFRSEPGAQTGPDGRATLESVWAGQRIELQIADSNSDGPPRSFGRELDGRLLSESSGGGRPILLEPTEVRELTAVIESGVEVRGAVVDERSQPVPGAFVRLEGSWESEAAHPAVSGQCDAAGRFALEVPSSLKNPKFRLTATDRDFREFDRKGARKGSIGFDLSSGPASDLVLVLRTSSRIAGHVLSTDGKRVSGVVVAFAQPHSTALGPWGWTSLIDKESAFAVEGLEPGRYDLWARPNDPYGEVRVSGVDSGREDVEVRVPDGRPAHVTIEVALREGETGEAIFLEARRWPGSSGGAETAALLPDAAYSDFRGWPRSVPWMGSGVGGFEEDGATASFRLTPMKQSSTRIDLDEGVYWFGARGKDRDGRALFPVGSGLVRVVLGEYHLRFVLVPAVRVQGRLVGDHLLDLEVGIAHGGDLLELDGGARELRSSRPVGADGSFVFSQVPVGENEIWIGTPSELAAGRPAQRQPLTVDAKGVPFLEIPIR